MKFNSFDDLGKIKDSFEDGPKTRGVVEDLPSKKEEINNITKKILDTDFSKIDATETMDFLYGTLKENRPTMYENEIRSLYNKYIEQSKNSVIPKRLPFEIGRSIMDYTSDNKIKDKLTNESTLDRSYRVFYEVAETNPEEMHNLSEWTHHLFEFVKPEVFFDTYIKIKESKVLNRYFGGSQFSQLEYNMSYCGTQKYVKALLSKIDFKDSPSCLKSSQLINLATSLAEYSKNGSYSGNYNVHEEIVKGFKSEMDNPESVYLLGSKTRYIVSRFENGYHPFVHQRSIFKIAPNKFACIKNGELCVAEETDNQLNNKVNKYIEIDNQIHTPPLELVDEAIRLGRDYVDWEADRRLTATRERMKEELFSSMLPVSENDLSLSFKSVGKSQLSEYINLVGTDYRNFLVEEFNFDFSEISVPEQFYFLEFLQKQNNSSVLPIKEFTNKYKKDGFRTFLSIEQGGDEMGDKILNLGEKLPEESAKILFEKYGEIIDEVDNIAGYLSKSTEGKTLSLEVINSAKENLLLRGKDLLNNYATKASVCNGDECINIGKELEEKLSNIKSSLLLFASACKSLSEEGLLSIEDLANTDLEIIHGGIDEKTQDEMKRIFKENRPNYSKELLDDVTKEFEDALKNSKENQTFYILRNNKDIASFMRLDEQEDGSIYGASFNVRTELRGSSIGTELMKKIVVKESSSRLFKILCYEKNPMLEKYKTDFGFNIVGEIDNYHNTGEKFYKMERSPSSNQ